MGEQKTFATPAVVFGAFLIVAGGYDDSPGLQAIGLVTAVGGIVWAIKTRRKSV